MRLHLGGRVTCVQPLTHPRCNPALVYVFSVTYGWLKHCNITMDMRWGYKTQGGKLLPHCPLWVKSFQACDTFGHTRIHDVTTGVFPFMSDRKHLLFTSPIEVWQYASTFQATECTSAYLLFNHQGPQNTSISMCNPHTKYKHHKRHILACVLSVRIPLDPPNVNK